MKQVEALRKIIREEVRAVFQQELAGILKEAIAAPRQAPVIAEARAPKQAVPSTLNRTAPRIVPPILGEGNPLNSLLAETAVSMTPTDMQGLYGDTESGYGMEFEPQHQIVESVDSMLSSARKSSVVEGVEITEVPDFTAIMSKMKATGQI